MAAACSKVRERSPPTICAKRKRRMQGPGAGGAGRDRSWVPHAVESEALDQRQRQAAAADLTPTRFVPQKSGVTPGLRPARPAQICRAAWLAFIKTVRTLRFGGAQCSPSFRIAMVILSRPCLTGSSAWCWCSASGISRRLPISTGRCSRATRRWRAGGAAPTGGDASPSLPRTRGGHWPRSRRGIKGAMESRWQSSAR